jgi:hypothetical protein
MAASQPKVVPTPVAKVPRTQLIRAADVKPEKIEHLWNGRFPRSMFSLVGGRPGEGKSLMMYLLAAEVSQQGQAVIMSSPEEALGAVKMPRLLAAGADTTRVHLWPNRLRLPQDVEDLELLVRLHNVGLITLDPIAKHLNGTNDPYKGLEPLIAMAERTGVALVGVHHVNKRVPRDAHPRDVFGGGNGGWLGTCREAHVLGRIDSGDEGSRFLACVKNNNGDDGGPAVEFYMDESEVDLPDGDVQDTARLVLVNDAVLVEANAVVHFKGAGAAGGDGAASGEKMAVAIEFLTLLLAPNGPVPVSEIEQQGKAMGVSLRTLRRASEGLGVIKKREGFGPGSFVTWALPDDHPAMKMVRSAQKLKAKDGGVDDAIDAILGGSDG